MADFEQTINELAGNAGPASKTSLNASNSAGCFTAIPPLNPINQLIIGVFGENYFPPFSAAYQPSNRESLVDETLLQMQFPGGGKIRPIGEPLHVNISDYIAPMTAMLSGVFNFFGPIFIILDVLRAIIDIICSFFQPIPSIEAIIRLFVVNLPPLIALFPPVASILLALNTIKLIVAIVTAMLSSIVPIIENIVASANSIIELLNEGNLGAIVSVTSEICTLNTHLENEIGALAPIKFVIEVLNTFLNLGSKFFCVQGLSDSPCCTDDTCPPVLINPPAGKALVIRDQNRFSLLDAINMGFEAVFPIIQVVSDIIELIVNVVLSGIEVVFNTVVGAVEVVLAAIGQGISFIADAVEATIGGILDLVNFITFFAFDGDIQDAKDSLDISFDANLLAFDLLELDLPDVDIPAPRTLEEALEALPLLSETLAALGLSPDNILSILDSVVFVAPETEIKFLLTGGNNVVSQVNENGLLSAVGVGHNYTVDELEVLQNFIVEPERIPASQVENEPATLRCRMRKLDGNGNPTGPEILAPIAIPVKDFSQNFLATGNSTYPGDQLVLRTDAFEEDDEIEFSIEPDFVALLSLNLVGFGCHPDIQSAAQGLVKFINADVDEDQGETGFDPVSDKADGDVPPAPIEDLEECFAAQVADPTVSQIDCFSGVVGDYVQDLTEFFDSVLCAGASRIQSPFETNKEFVLANGKDSALITLSIKDAGGNNLLLGALPTSSFRVEWRTTVGTFGPTLFDATTGEFSVTLTSENVGLAEVFAEFIVDDKVCLRPGNFDGFVVTDNTLDIEFTPERGHYPRQRRDRQYVQSRGGRRR